MGTGVVVVSRALDADRGGGCISRRLADDEPMLGLYELFVADVFRKVKISLNGSCYAVGACDSAMAVE